MLFQAIVRLFVYKGLPGNKRGLLTVPRGISHKFVSHMVCVSVTAI